MLMKKKSVLMELTDFRSLAEHKQQQNKMTSARLVFQSIIHGSPTILIKITEPSYYLSYSFLLGIT